MCRRPSGNISGRSFEHLRLAVAGGGGYAAVMKQVFLVVALSFLLMAPLGAVPNVFFSNGTGNFPVIPAFPRFNADLTEEFLDPGNWRKAEFSGPWEDEPSLPDLAIRRMSAMPTVFGEVPMSIQSFEKEGGVAEIAIHFLDAGVFFGYLGGETTKEQRDAMRQRRVEFSRYYRDLSASLQEKLEQGCGRGVAGRLGRSPMLSLGYIDFTWEDFTLRFVEREDHSISLHLFREGSAPTGLVASDWKKADRREREAMLGSRVRELAAGRRELADFPVFSQGSTPFCGVHSLAMVGHYLGLRTHPGMLAASAGFDNDGSAAGSDLVELHRAVAAELDMRLSVAPKLDPGKMRRSLEEGVPVLIWRRVSVEREAYHREVAGTGTPLRPLSPAELEQLPRRDSRRTPSHASVVTGIEPDHGTILYVEPWGHDGLGRRMRIEEAEATTYAVFYFKL